MASNRLEAPQARELVSSLPTAHCPLTTSRAFGRSRFGLVSSSSSLQPPVSSLGFTLVELLITITIIGIMASMILFALYRAQETAKAHKTRALIAKLDAVIKDKWQTYQYRRVPVDLGPERYDDMDGSGNYNSGDMLHGDWNGDGTYTQNADGSPKAPTPREAAKIRLESIHDLMRMELPDRFSDIKVVAANGSFGGFAGPATFQAPTPFPTLTVPSLFNTYSNRVSGTVENQSAEMLYLIVMAALASDDDSRDVFKPDNIGDTDNGGIGDGMPEFIDGWGRPIKFLRWPAGMISDLQIVARVVVQQSQPNGSTTTVTVNDPKLSATNGAYVGGAMGVIEPSPPSPNANVQPKPINGQRMARITGYTYSGGIGTFTCAGSPAGQAFNGNPPKPQSGDPPNARDTVVIMAPDPFDPTDAQRFWANLYYQPDKYVPSFAIYPLIYSAGPDGQFGIFADIDDKGAGIAPYSYGGNGVRPFVEFSALNGNLQPIYAMFGTAAVLRVNGVDQSPNASLDNIHNHLQGLR